MSIILIRIAGCHYPAIIYFRRIFRNFNLVSRRPRYVGTRKSYSNFKGTVERWLTSYSVAMQIFTTPRCFPLVQYVFSFHIGLTRNHAVFVLRLYLMCMVRKSMTFLCVSWIISSGILRMILLSSFFNFFPCFYSSVVKLKISSFCHAADAKLLMPVFPHLSLSGHFQRLCSISCWCCYCCCL